MTWVRPKRCSSAATLRRKVWNGSLVGGEVIAAPEAQVRRRRVVRRHRRGDEDRADHDDDQCEDEELLAPLATEQPPRPSHDGTAGREPPWAAGPASRTGGVRARLVMARKAAAATPGLAEAPSGRRSRPSRRKTTRSAHEASWASWVTTTAATPCLQAARSIRITASPFAESSAPDGSSARRRWRSTDDGAGDGDALALSAGKLVGIMRRPIGEAELLEDRHPGDTGLSCAGRRRARVEARRSPLR